MVTTQKKGRQVPTQSVVLPYTVTKGNESIEIYNSTGKTAQECTDDQEFALKYVVSDSKNPQTIFCGTPPTPVSSGTVFTKLRNKTLAGATVNGGWAEWSIEDQADVHDRDLWYETNPSLGTVLTERAILDEITSDPIDFNIQRMGLWIKYNQKSAISKAEWESLSVNKLPKLKGKLFVGSKYGRDGTNVTMSIACKTDNGQQILADEMKKEIIF